MNQLPWNPTSTPLMLAPMQGLTNRALRRVMIELVRPDVVFTEFIQVRKPGRRIIADSDRLEIQEEVDGVPLVIQLIGADTDSLVAAAELVQELGGRHLNINLGCPYGRMGKKSAGGALLREPKRLEEMLRILRGRIHASFSLKIRAGYRDPEELTRLLPIFADCGIDFLILHARTVEQEYTGRADHTITGQVVRNSQLPVIANGDIFTAETGRKILEKTGAGGLMLGRGAIGDPYLFQRLRGKRESTPAPARRRAELHCWLERLIAAYGDLFSGEKQILDKTKEVLAYINDADLKKTIKQLRKSTTIRRFRHRLDTLPAE